MQNKKSPADIVAEAVERYGSGREEIVQLLSAVNEELGYIPEEAMREIAGLTGVSNAEVYSVATFYSFFSTKPRGKHIIRLCNTISCSMKGAGDILSALQEELGVEVGETTSDGRITLETTSCLGLCDGAPALLIGDVPYTELTPERAREIVRGLE